MMLSHPMGHSSILSIAILFAGPALFLLGNQAFKWVTAGVKYPPLSHFIGLLLLTLIAVSGWWWDWQPLTLGIAATGALIATALWEWFSLHGGWQRWAPWMGPMFSWIPQNPN